MVYGFGEAEGRRGAQWRSGGCVVIAEEIYLGLGYSYFGVTYFAGQDDAPDNVEFSVSLGETGLGLTIGDYDDVGQYTILAYDLPISLAGLSIGLAWNDIDYDDDAAEDDDVFAITFSM